MPFPHAPPGPAENELLGSVTKNQPKEEVFGRTSLRTSGQKLRSAPPNPRKQAFWHGRAARTSTQKLRSEKLRADFLSQKHSLPEKNLLELSFDYRYPI